MQITKREFLKRLGLAGAAGVTGEAAAGAEPCFASVTGTVLFIR